MWYSIELVRTRGCECTYRVVVKFWHPGFWMDCFQSLRLQDAGVLEALYLTVRAVIALAKKRK